MAVLLLTLTLASCTPDPDYPMFYHHMVELEQPLNENDFWFSHEFKLNEKETLFYAPKTVRYAESIYLNEREAYFIRTERSGIWGAPYKYEEPSVETLKEIFNWSS
jgi:hypothetical protein